MGSKKPTQTTTESSASPSYVTGAQQNFLGSVMPALAPQLTGGGIAPFNQDQESAFGQIRGAVGQPINQNVYSFTPAQAAAMQAAVAQGAQLDPNAYKPFLNPYTSEVVDRTTANMQRQHENDLNAIRARAAAGNSFADSGARAALKESTATDNYNRAVGDVTAQLMAQGYDKATATAMANTQLQQQTNLANAGFQQQANQVLFLVDRSGRGSAVRSERGSVVCLIPTRRGLAARGFTDGWLWRAWRFRLRSRRPGVPRHPDGAWNGLAVFAEGRAVREPSADIGPGDAVRPSEAI
jgi:hypothetical protein